MQGKKILKKIAVAVWIFLSGITAAALFFFRKEKKNDIEERTEQKRNEIKETSAADVVAGSPCQSDIQSAIKDEQSDFRRRIRDRFNKEL